mmetsp:Transcript_7375/g.17825  ORF Transcript_7375/g.17825 Transcript_7375/m.17825 type:complete len:220 (-) Transcript_7375:219-878(-)
MFSSSSSSRHLTPWSSAQAAMTAPSFTQYTMMSSTPRALRSPCFARYPGTWRLDQVGVKAPGRPITRTFLPSRRSSRAMVAGGNPWWRLRPGGTESPTSMAAAVTKSATKPHAMDDKPIFMVCCLGLGCVCVCVCACVRVRVLVLVVQNSVSTQRALEHEGMVVIREGYGVEFVHRSSSSRSKVFLQPPVKADGPFVPVLSLQDGPALRVWLRKRVVLS